MPASHIVHFILDAVEQLPITDFRVNERGSGSEQFPSNPDGTHTAVTVFAAVEKSDRHKTVAELLPQPEPLAPGPAPLRAG